MIKLTRNQFDVLQRLSAAQATALPTAAEMRPCPFTAKWSEPKRLMCSTCGSEGCRRYRELGLDDSGAALPLRARPICGALTRRGTSCACRVVPGKRRGRFHGGLSTGPVTAEGKQRIAKAQRERWVKWRSERHLETER